MMLADMESDEQIGTGIFSNSRRKANNKNRRNDKKNKNKAISESSHNQETEGSITDSQIQACNNKFWKRTTEEEALLLVEISENMGIINKNDRDSALIRFIEMEERDRKKWEEEQHNGINLEEVSKESLAF